MQAAYTMHCGYLARIGTWLRVHFGYKFAHLDSKWSLGSRLHVQVASTRRRGGIISVKLDRWLYVWDVDKVRTGDCSVRVARNQGLPSGSTVAEHWQAILHEPRSVRSTAGTVALRCSDPHGVKSGICTMHHIEDTIPVTVVAIECAGVPRRK